MKNEWEVETWKPAVKVLLPSTGGRPFHGLVEELRTFTGKLLVELPGVKGDCLLPSNMKEFKTQTEALLALSRLKSTNAALLCGRTTGFAACIALSCDFRVGTPDTAFVFQEVSRGLVPPGETLWNVAALSGIGEAIRMLVSGTALSAKECLSYGLLDRTGPQAFLREFGAEVHAFKRRKPKRLFRTRLGCYIIKKQALSELSARSSPKAASSVVRLLLEYLRKRRTSRIRALLQESERLFSDPEHARLTRFQKLRQTFSPGEKYRPKRALVLAENGGWEWVYLLARNGVKVRWSCPAEKVLADGLCWIRRDLEKNFPDQINHVLSLISVSRERCGFAGRDLVVLGNGRVLSGEEKSHLPQRVVVLACGKQDSLPAAEEKEAEISCPRVWFPQDPFSSHTCLLRGGSGKAEALLRGLGFILLPPKEGEVVFEAVKGFESRWEELKKSGYTDRFIISSLQSYGFATRQMCRRKYVFGRLKKGNPETACKLVSAVRESLGSLRTSLARSGLVDFFLVLELGFPAHKGGISGTGSAFLELDPGGSPHGN